MAVHHLARQAERHAKLANLVLEELAQRLEELEVKGFGKTTDIVVGLDGRRLLSLAARRLDDVRIDRALREPLCVLYLLGLALKHFDEMLADDLALGLGVG